MTYIVLGQYNLYCPLREDNTGTGHGLRGGKEPAGIYIWIHSCRYQFHCKWPYGKLPRFFIQWWKWGCFFQKGLQPAQKWPQLIQSSHPYPQNSLKNKIRNTARQNKVQNLRHRLRQIRRPWWHGSQTAWTQTETSQKKTKIEIQKETKDIPMKYLQTITSLQTTVKY